MNGTVAFTVDFRQKGHPGVASDSPPRTLRVARLLALAHQIDVQVRAGVYDDLADAARELGLTRARVTQIVNLELLAPEIQAEILALPPITKGRDRITERTLRPIVAEPLWDCQMSLWRRLREDTL